MKKDVTVQRVSGVVNLSDFPSEAFAASGWYVNDTTEYQTGIVTDAGIGTGRCRGESFYAWFRIFFYPEKIVYENWFPAENQDFTDT